MALVEAAGLRFVSGVVLGLMVVVIVMAMAVMVFWRILHVSQCIRQRVHYVPPEH